MTAPAGWITVDLHCHTRASFDSLSEPNAVLEAARARGIDRIAITDHDAVEAAMEMHAMAPDRVIVGEEVKTREGFDVIGLFLRELIPSRTPAREVCERIRGQGGVVYVPHPFDSARSGAGQGFLESLADLIDVVEIHNSRCLFSSSNARALAWAERHGKLQGAGSDAHTLREIGNGRVELPPFAPERESFLSALAGGRVSGCVRTSPVARLASSYAKIHKRIAGRLRR
jgi:predicted metal-dependent phosphoesterase TrpH